MAMALSKQEDAARFAGPQTRFDTLSVWRYGRWTAKGAAGLANSAEVFRQSALRRGRRQRATLDPVQL